MALTIVWSPSPQNIAELLGIEPQLDLPYLIDNSQNSAPGNKLHATLIPQELTLGILVADPGAAEFVDTVESPQQLRSILKKIALHRGFRSEDILCAVSASHLHVRYGVNIAVKALRRALVLVPDGMACRGDLIVSLFQRAANIKEGLEQDFEEAAELFLKWHAGQTTESKNAEDVIYCGLATLIFLGRNADLGAVVNSRPDFFHCSAHLQERLNRLSKARAGHLEDILPK